MVHASCSCRWLLLMTDNYNVTEKGRLCSAREAELQGKLNPGVVFDRKGFGECLY
jgi:hypothetical protein